MIWYDRTINTIDRTFFFYSVYVFLRWMVEEGDRNVAENWKKKYIFL